MSGERKLTVYRGVRRRKEVTFFGDALKQAGCSIRVYPDATVAPFVFSVDLPSGEPLDLVCYIFRANKYGQKNRPDDEHRLQVKYGSEFDRFHDIYLPQSREEVTLFVGVHFEAGVLIAVDPSMHNPTWFSRSIEFKSHHVDEILEEGWLGWERDRRAGKSKDEETQKLLLTHSDLRSEVLLGFTPKRVVDYILLERVATGIPPGERLRLIESGPVPVFDDRHDLERELDLPIEDIMDMIESAARLKVAVRGRAAEKHLHRVLSSEPELERVEEIDQDGQPDFLVTYKGVDVRIECKNTLRKLTRGCPKVDFQKTRASKGDPCSRYYRPEQFEILAACLHPISELWEFRFFPTQSLPPHKVCAGHLSQNVLVGSDGWSDSIIPVLRSIASESP